ncbi:hypothetical protein A3724_06700 [Alcanivorax sp. HI0033]|uniref:amidoligase family protein n=1 Tax=unclassified Alcanivorax TaxID=2638842 RepID=UPI0007B93C2F|nr:MULTISPECIES: amidoligase family protein [unclassified Alcanivorax]KZX73661.1 hypothetical protein A3716_13210 [Alcanivorax sp. HI0011]KZX77605.1 hypothetical protein A3717_12085 [Alcanivorax sp. HI0013]KZY12450.1 hypothetical protein A3725_13750 [Alcanivorax sp. HI0035]KZX61898.1 hypothetical protein A3713_08190 [Alcanivorax sp. HI0003]KZX68944.1 hypothetical protein A3714_08310 [Alcanivorax sp. HI0007]
MDAYSSRLETLNALKNTAGKVRTVGFELEFSGITFRDTARVVCDTLNGKVTDETAAEVCVQTDHGDFNIELDWDFLKTAAANAGETVDELLHPLSKAAALLVPVEVVCPPLPVTSLTILDGMVEALRKAGATGTEESLIAAYGVHINAEVPALDAPTIHRYLRAFGLLQWWQIEANDVNLARRISPYIDLFEESYIKLLLTRDEPDIATLIDDYLEHNPTRNRALDMLPLFAEIDADRVRATVDDPKIKSRPTFHYRLPNCQIDDPQWSLNASWLRWCWVEQLANDDASLQALGKDFLTADRPLLGVDRGAWVKRIARWMENHA